MNIRRSPLQRGTTPLKRTPLRKVSTKRAAQLREYTKLRAAYLEAHPICEVWLHENGWKKTDLWFKENIGETTVTYATENSLVNYHGAPRATEIHHKNKRRGAMLNDQTHWMAVCRENHERIEQDKAWSRANGFLENF